MSHLRPLIAATAAAALAVAGCSTTPADNGLPLRKVAEMALPGGAVRFDYAALDATRGRLFIAHMGASELIDVDVRGHVLNRTVANLADVHGVIVVPETQRVYATATGTNELVAIAEDSGRILFRAATDSYPDGLAYDPIRRAVWTTNERSGTETVIDADTAARRATVPLGGEVGNVVYDPRIDRIIVAVQGRNDLSVVDPASFAVQERIPTPGCDHPHGQALDTTDQLMFVGCEDNATMVTVDLAKQAVVDRERVGETPDVLAYDPQWGRVYVAAESGWVTILGRREGHVTTLGSAHLADGAHSLAVDPTTHHTYSPIANGPGGGPILWEFEPTA